MTFWCQVRYQNTKEQNLILAIFLEAERFSFLVSLSINDKVFVS